MRCLARGEIVFRVNICGSWTVERFKQPTLEVYKANKDNRGSRLQENIDLLLLDNLRLGEVNKKLGLLKP